MFLEVLILLTVFSLSDCQFVCNAIHSEFVVFSNETNSIAFTGSYDYFIQPFYKEQDQIIVEPVNITYNANSSIYSGIYSDLTTSAHPGYCGEGSRCVLVDSTGAYVFISFYHNGVNYTGHIVADAVIFDYGNIKFSNGEYIGTNNANNLSVGINMNWSDLFFPIYQKSKCTSFIRLPDVDTSIPKCLELIGDTVIYNVTNNNETLASIRVKYTLDDVMTATADLKIISNLFNHTELTVFEIDDSLYNLTYGQDFNHQMVTKNFTNDQITLSSFRIDYVSPDLGALDGRIGKFIYRNGVVLMDENTPFSPDNYCKEYKPIIFTDDDVLLVATTICCESFSK